MNVESLFSRAVDLDATERETLLDELDREHPAEVREVRSLLAAYDAAPGLLDHPAVESFELDADEAEDRLPGTRVGSFEIGEVIGTGGMATVYSARRVDAGYEQRVALKVLKRGLDTDELLGRFRAERQVLARLDHHFIVSILDGGELPDGRPYVAMDLVDGEPIDRHCDDGALALGRRIDLFLGVCDAIQHAHERFVVHRDLKPSNILVTRDHTPRLLDFGIAKVIDGETPGSTTTPGSRSPMTLLYASPEQVRGEPVTTASDVYSLGVILYRLLVGREPYEGPPRSRTEIERAVLAEEPVKPSLALARIDDPPSGVPATALRGDLDVIMGRALAKDPSRRYSSVRELADDLRRHRSGTPVHARGDHFGYRANRFLARHRWPVLGLAGVLIGLLGVSFALWRDTHRAREGEGIAWQAHGAAVAATEALQDVLLDLAGRPDTDRATLQNIMVRLESRLDGDLADLPETQARVRMTLAEAWLILDEPQRALPHAAKASTIISTTRGFGRKDGARSQVLVGRARVGAGFPDGLTEIRRGVQLWVDARGADSAPTLEARYRLAEALSKVGQREEAVTELEGVISADATPETIRSEALAAFDELQP